MSVGPMDGKLAKTRPVHQPIKSVAAHQLCRYWFRTPAGKNNILLEVLIVLLSHSRRMPGSGL
jgi:hypothetical protein